MQKTFSACFTEPEKEPVSAASACEGELVGDIVISQKENIYDSLSAVDGSLEKFFSNIDDHLYTPVYSIMGFLRLIDLNQDKEEKAYCCDAIMQSGWLFIEMLENLMAPVREEESIVSDPRNLTFPRLVDHELRTPFNAIIGLSELMKITDEAEVCRDYCEDIQDSCLKVCDRIHNILNFALLRAGVDCGSMSSFSIEASVLEVSGLYRARATNKGLDFWISFEGAPLMANCLDNDLLKGALNQLLDNAIKFTSEGHVSLRVSKYYNSAERQWRLDFQIEDSGEGIESGKSHLIFAPFQQGDISMQRSFEGLGLGLSIAQKQVEALGGVITCSSNLNKGSTFRFCIPCSKVEKSTAETVI